MVQSLEEYVAQASRAYEPAKSAIQSQLDALSGQYATTESKINRNYDQQQSQLESQRNQAAEASSMAAAGSGGSFGGQGNIARRKYYEQTFVPAQTQLQTNKANELDTARQNMENQRTSLNSQMSNLQAQAQQQALQQYWAAVEAEKQREEQRRLAASQNSAQNAYYKYLMDAMKNGGGGTSGGGNKTWDFGSGYKLVQGNNGRAYYMRGNNQISAGEFLVGTSAARRSGPYANVWNDVWKNGVNTYGVGADTVNAFRNNSARNLSNYNDLFRM